MQKKCDSYLSDSQDKDNKVHNKLKLSVLTALYVEPRTVRQWV